MSIGIVIPTLCEADRIRGAVEDVVRRGFEVVVSDGGSTDGTPELARRAGARVVVGPAGRGPQLNRGAAELDSSVLCFLHADCRLPEGAAARMGQALADPAVVAGAFVIRTVDDDNSGLQPLLRLCDARSRFTRHPYGDQAVFVRRSAFAAVGGYPDQPLFEDVEFARRLWRVGRMARVDAEVSVSGRRFVQQPVRATIAMNVFPTLYRCGLSVDRLAAWYGAPR